MYYARPNVPKLRLDVVGNTVLGGPGCPSLYSCRTTSGLALEVHYRNGWLTIEVNEAVDTATGDLVTLFEASIGPPFHSDILFEQVCDVAGLTIDGQLPRSEPPPSNVEGDIIDFSGATRLLQVHGNCTVDGVHRLINELAHALPKAQFAASKLGAFAHIWRLCVGFSGDLTAFGASELFLKSAKALAALRERSDLLLIIQLSATPLNPALRQSTGLFVLNRAFHTTFFCSVSTSDQRLLMLQDTITVALTRFMPEAAHSHRVQLDATGAVRKFEAYPAGRVQRDLSAWCRQSPRHVIGVWGHPPYSQGELTGWRV